MKKRGSKIDDFKTKNLEAWGRILGRIFPVAIPTRAVWNDRQSIIAVLKILGCVSDLTHVFFPNGGGLDLDGARESAESECIELDTGIACILKPAEFTFESFGPPYEQWAYFRIEAATLAPSGVYETLQEPYEELTEIRSGLYVDRGAFDSGKYEIEGRVLDIPSSARGIIRYLGGAFVIFAKGSLYNRNRDTYDARHAKMTAVEFRSHLTEAIHFLGSDAVK